MTTATLPVKIPVRYASSASSTTLASADQFSLYDVAIGGIGFEYANEPNNPLVRETAPATAQRIDQAEDAGEQTLTNWWLKSQESFHGGAGQLNLEPPFETPISHVRFDVSKNVDPFVPGRVRRLPDTARVSTDVATGKIVALTVSGSDAVAYISGTSVKLLTNVTGTPSSATFATVTSPLSLATDGVSVFAATATTIYKLDPTNPSAGPTTVATFPASSSDAVLGWVKSRLMAGANGAVYEVDITQTGVTLGSTQLKYQNPTSGFSWVAFASGPQALLAAGNSPGGASVVTSFTVQNSGNAPVLAVAGDIAEMPKGERILSMIGAQGSFVVFGTTSGIRVGTYDSYYGRLYVGPLHLSLVDPVIPANGLAARGNYVYAAGKDYDEAGLLALDLGTQTDQAGRYAWAPHLITTAYTTSQSATSVVVLPLSNRVVFATPAGLWLEGTAPGTGREAWLRTSRIRHGTVEPKLFKMGRVRGDLANGSISATGITAVGSYPLATVGFTTGDPGEFRLPSPLTEWLQLKLQLTGQVALWSYQTKALPGTPRSINIRPVLALYDRESTRRGQQITDALSTRDRLSALEALARAGDEVLFQEFTPSGVVSTICVIEQVSFQQVGRPTRTSDLGGIVAVTLRTVES